MHQIKPCVVEEGYTEWRFVLNSESYFVEHDYSGVRLFFVVWEDPHLVAVGDAVYEWLEANELQLLEP